MNYFLRLAIAFDAFVQSWFRFGTHGITISSRAATGAAHGHKWALAMWWLLDRMWPFGRDKVTGESHCAAAVRHDIMRAQAVIAELEDVQVQAYLASRDQGRHRVP